MPTKTDMPDRWYSTKEICAYLGISRDTMLVWISTKNMPAHKVGRNWKFKVSEVDEWIKSGQAAEEGWRNSMSNYVELPVEQP